MIYIEKLCQYNIKFWWIFSMKSYVSKIFLFSSKLIFVLYSNSNIAVNDAMVINRSKYYHRHLYIWLRNLDSTLEIVTWKFCKDLAEQF